MFEQMFTRSGVVMLLVDPESGAIVDANPAAARFYGHDRAVLTRMQVQDLETLPPQEVAADLAAAATGGRPQVARRHVRAGGEIRDVDASCDLVRLGDRHLLHMIVFDRSQERRLEARLQRTAEEQASLLDNMPIQVWLIAADQTYAAVNAAHARFLGRAKADLLARPLEEFLPPAVAEVCRQQAADAAATGEAQVTQEWALDADGRRRLLRIHRVPTRVIGSHSPAVICTAEDITEQHLAEEALRRHVAELEAARDTMEEQGANLVQLAEEAHEARQRAEAAAGARSQFLAAMSHEIRTPLTAILGMADVLAQSDLGSQQNAQVAAIRSAGDSLLGIVNDVLDQARLDAGRIRIEPEDLHLPGLVAEVSDMVRHRIDPSRVSVATTIALDVPEGIRADPVRLRQVLVNLLGNAAKFTEDGRIETAVHRDGDRLVFTITDTGIGIAPEARARLFRAFEQADGSTTRRFGGSGLGLSISRRLVEQWGGEISADSAVGVGSAFRFTLPLVPAIGPVVAPTSRSPVHRFHAARPLAILLAEDNRLNRALFTTQLGGLGHHIVAVEDGAQAVDAARGDPGRYDLVLMDIHMPELDGVDATRRIREAEAARGGRRLPIIALTADVLPEHVARYRAAGLDGVATKPVDLPALLAEIDRVVGEPVHTAAPASAAGTSGQKGARDERPVSAGLDDLLARMADLAAADDGD